MAGYAAWYVSTPLTLANVPVEVEIPRGASLRGVMDALESAGIRLRRVEFETLARALRKERAIKAGSYEIAEPLTPTELLEKLTRGDVTQAEVRLIEGWTFGQFRAALDASPDLRHDTAGLEDTQILAAPAGARAASRGPVLSRHLSLRQGLERPRGAAARVPRDAAAPQEGMGREDARLPYQTPYEALIMASIIEKETGKPEERDLIGGVLVNRLRIGMRLQVDPTIIYGLGNSFDGNLKKNHLIEDGPYNTYTRAGLPPTPIAMPGIASLRAALRPGKTEALYYVSRGDGSSQFSRTLDEHNRAVSRYQLRRPPK